MNGHCAKCNAEIAASWKFCPMCGASNVPEQAEAKLQASEAEPVPTQGAYSGLLFGILVVPMLLIVGTLLCLTGLGAILGIPMILAGILAPLIGPMIGIRSHSGHCPYCGAALSNIESGHNATCPVCNRAIAVKHGMIVRAA